MRINIGKVWQKRLAQLPETGMGSQHVDFTLKSGLIIRNVPVFNGEECEVEEAFDPQDIKDVSPHQV
jgi:hypothetical protein